MPDLIATQRFTYGTRRLKADAPFKASKQDARVLVALGKARYALDAAQEPVMTKLETEVVTEALPAADAAETAPAAAPEQGKRKGRKQ
jgi:hypothetical protein